MSREALYKCNDITIMLCETYRLTVSSPISYVMLLLIYISSHFSVGLYLHIILHLKLILYMVVSESSENILDKNRVTPAKGCSS